MVWSFKTHVLPACEVLNIGSTGSIVVQFGTEYSTKYGTEYGTKYVRKLLPTVEIEPLSNSNATGSEPRSVYYYTGSISDYGGEKPRVARLIGSNYRVWSLQVRLLLQSKELWRVMIEGPEESSIKVYSTLGRIGYPPGRYSNPRIGFRGLGENSKETPEKKSSKGKDSKVLEEALQQIYAPVSAMNLASKLREFSSLKLL
ncbi:uncharacterized protein RSE6_05067 [Rhynchosporium secalis]|uniref:DUF4219 domain-containing protein n=1 Tax=Rhynchosporium secalis TaxID=38038 RepID=A0A1E1M6W4_RHYSE|nr:uncharacterized protein RSE6_05067 [Rhynchosporium secalis]